MFSTLRTRFGIPGVISVIALVFAMFGGAYAASNSSNAGKATASAKAKKGPKGPKGATGPAGPAGAQGPAGPAGAKGDAGANGSNGTAGATGATGPTGGKGTAGAAGATGATGATGFSGFTETLPSGKTETGVWSIDIPAGSNEVVTPISFPIPTAKAGSGASVHFFTLEKVKNKEFGTTGCKWELAEPEARPEATQPGTLCIFTQEAALSEAGGGEPGAIHPIGVAASLGFGPAGAYMTFAPFGNLEQNFAYGAWAVSGP